MAIKLADKPFFNKFKNTDFPRKLFSGLQTHTDEIITFALGYIVCLFTQDDGVLNMLIREYNVIEFLTSLLTDDTEIETISKKRKLGMSKIAQSYVKELKEKIVHPTADSNEECAVSRRFIGLNGLLEISSKLSLSDVPDSDRSVAKVITLIAEIGKSRTPNLHDIFELHMGVLVLENSSGGVCLLPAESRQDAIVLILSLLSLIGFLLDSSTKAVGVALAIMRECIVATNNGADLQREYSWDPVTLQQIYIQLQECVQIVVANSDAENSRSEDVVNMALFALGLYVNLTELTPFRELLTREVASLCSLFESAKHVKDVQKYLALSIGSLVRTDHSNNLVRKKIPAETLFSLGRVLEQMRAEVEQGGGATTSRGTATATAEQFGRQIRDVIAAVYGSQPDGPGNFGS